MSNIDYTLWPNAGGTLGQNKVQIPDGVTTTWPTGDVLVGNFVYNKGHLVGFVDTKALIANESKSTTFPYDYVNIQVDKSLEGVMTFNQGERTKYLTITYSGNSGDTIVLGTKYLGCKTVDEVKAVDPNYLTNDIIDGVWSEGLWDLEQGNKTGWWNGGMFYNCIALTSFSSDLSSLTDGSCMFSDCFNLTSFNADLSSLTDGSSMFRHCSKLASFTSDLSSLTDGNLMFYYCSNLTTFTSDLSSLTDGSSMFIGCSNLKSFTSDLSSLTNGNSMFCYCVNLESFSSDLSSLTNGSGMFSGCSKLASFTSDLSSLTDGNCMFNYCENLIKFNGDLRSLTDGLGMFNGCKLDTSSVQNIADTINTAANNKKLDIGIGNSSPNEQEEAAFNQMVDKGWIVFVNSNYYGGDEGGMYGYTASASLASSAMTLDEMGETEMFAPKPYWAKPVPSDEEHAKYIDSEGNFYNILGAQFIYGDNLETYGMFTCEEDAAANMRLTKIEK